MVIKKISTQLPVYSLIQNEIKNCDFVDSFSILSERNKINSSELLQVYFHSSPKWVEILYKIRRKFAKLVNLKTGEGKNKKIDPPYIVGQYIGLFRIYQMNNNEVILGEKDKHLDFKVSLMSVSENGNTRIYITTLVNFNKISGKIYFAIIKPFHTLILKAVLRKMLPLFLLKEERAFN